MLNKMKIGITGSDGFIGWHLRCFLKTLDDIGEIRLANRETFASENELKSFAKDLDLIVHLAGINRDEDSQLIDGNITLAKLLTDALKSNNSNAMIVYASTTYSVDPTTPYGKGKSKAGELIQHWASEAGARFVNAVIPHVFGEYGKPNYNSGVATFCHQIANQLPLTVNRDGQLELIHVQDLVEKLYALFLSDVSGTLRVDGTKVSVGEIVDQLQALYDEYVTESRIPDLSNRFTRSLFNSLRGAIPNDERVVSPVKHTDDRGWLVETVKAGSKGQCFVSTTKPGITRGNHFHRRKVERFFVLQGTARIELRKLFGDDVIAYELNGESPSFVDIPTLHTHKITNVGNDELITLFWADEYFDPQTPDTYPESV